MQLINKTPFAVEAVIMPNINGIDALYTIVKATFNIGKSWTLADEQILPQGGDEYNGDPVCSSLKYATDFHIGKISTDIAIIGTAHSFEHKPVTQLDVGVSLGEIQKVVRVFGDRIWQSGLSTHPEEFVSIPLVYENAFGGIYTSEVGEVLSVEQRNPVGKGHKGKISNSDMHKTALPNIEDPKNLISTMNDMPEPAGFGFRAPHWSPRQQYGGIYDMHWKKNRAPYLPEDFSLKFNSCSHPDLIYPRYLQGGEPVKIVNMRPEGVLDFHLPIINLKGRVRIVRKHDQELKFVLETVIIEPESLTLQMTWKAAVVVNNDATKVNKIQISMGR